jgi:hypothetical protein
VLGMFRQILVKIPNMTFQENPSKIPNMPSQENPAGGSHSVPCERADIQTEIAKVNSRLS